MSEVLSAAEVASAVVLFSGVGTIASAMVKPSSNLPRELGGNFLFVMAAMLEPVGAFRPVLDPRGEGGLVGGRVLAPRLPLARVVLEPGLVDHGHAALLGAHRLAYPAAAAGLQVGVVEAVRRHVEAAVRTLQPAERALDALLEIDHRPHRAG